MTSTDPAMRAADAGMETSRYPHRQMPEYGIALAAAREALEPIRDLHVKTKNTGYCQNPECPCFKPEWVCSRGEWHREYEVQRWPCPTARIIYTAEELENLDD